MKQKTTVVFSQPRQWLWRSLFGASGVLADYSLDVTYSIGSLCGRWGLSEGRDNTQRPARSLGRQRKYGSPQISLTVTWLWRLLVLASWLALWQAPPCHRAVIEERRSSGAGERMHIDFSCFIYGALIERPPWALLPSKYYNTEACKPGGEVVGRNKFK